MTETDSTSKDKNIIVKCNLCASVTPRELSTSKNSNLKKHVDRCHANTKLTERDAGGKKRKRAEDESAGKSQTKQQKLSFSRSAVLLEPREVRRQVAEYVVEDMLPLSTVNSPAFKKFVCKIPTNTSNDKGSTHIRRITTELEDIFSQYGLTNDKVTACVTDNGSNFVKAFKEHQQQQVESEEEVEGDGEVEFTDLHSVLTADDDTQHGLCVLPPHHRCAAQTLNLIANNEVVNWLVSNPESRAVYRSATAKCSALWTKARRSTVASECLEEVSDRKLIVPTVTRWNSFYNAYARITEMPLTDINSLCTQLQIKCMNDREYQFLKECCAIMKPFTVALDILQGEDTCFYGTLQPTLEVLMAKTLVMKNGLSQMTTGLPEVIVGAIKTRFATTIDSKDALLAAVSLPKFKLRWVKEEARRDHIKFLLTTECRSLTTEEPTALMPDAPQPAATSEDDFFSFDVQPNATADVPMSVETEMSQWLKQP
nr:uncharacterized protein LOC114922126 [Labrus bergylta]